MSIEAVASRDPDLILTTTAGPVGVRRAARMAGGARRARAPLPAGERLRVQPAEPPGAGRHPRARAPAPGARLMRAAARWPASCSPWSRSACWSGSRAGHGPALAGRGLGRPLARGRERVRHRARPARPARAARLSASAGASRVCGAALQAMIRNPLAEPYLLGPLRRRGARRRDRHRHPGGRAVGRAGRRVRRSARPRWRWSTG